MTAVSEKLRALLDKAPRHILRNFETWQAAIAALDAAPRGQKFRIARLYARRLAVSPKTVSSRASLYRKHGLEVLLDHRFSPAWKRTKPTPVATKRPRRIRFQVITNHYWNGAVESFKQFPR